MSPLPRMEAQWYDRFLHADVCVRACVCVCRCAYLFLCRLAYKAVHLYVCRCERVDNGLRV